MENRQLAVAFCNLVDKEDRDEMLLFTQGAHLLWPNSKGKYARWKSVGAKTALRRNGAKGWELPAL